MLEILKKAIEIRAVELQLLQGYKDRQFGGTVHTCIGQELLPSILSAVLDNSPFIISNHRGHGHFIAHTNKIQGLFCEFLGRSGAQSFGVGGSQHLYANNFLSNGIQGCTSPFAVGIGMVRPTIIYMGDGTLGIGAVYEAFNMSKLVSSKILFVVEDNGISQTTPSARVLSGSIVKRFDSFGIHTVEVDSSNPLEMYNILLDLEDAWRENTVIALVVKSYRLNSHSKGDDTRPLKALERLPDPLKILSSKLGVDYCELLKQSSKNIIDIWNISLGQSKGAPPIKNKSPNNSIPYLKKVGPMRVNEIIRSSIDKALDADGMFIGEDIVTYWNPGDEPYGGAFGVSLGLSENHGKVIGSSISEAGIVGLAAGRSFASKKLSIAEIMFADFSTLIVDQLHNGVDKYKKMFGVDVKIPLVVRLPYGMGRGYGPTHSQSPFELFSGLSEIIVISYNPLIDYHAILEKTASQGFSVIIFEPKTLYGDRHEVWLKLLDNFNIISMPGDLVGNLLLSKGVNPKYIVICHGSAIKASIEAVIEFALDAQVLIVNELYRDMDYLDFLKMNSLPVIIVEEANCKYGSLWSSISKELYAMSASRKVLVSDYVDNIPANTEWEQNLIITKKTVLDLINEAIL
jgi:2-oxoisovalerate dehydrogenase E1 component